MKTSAQQLEEFAAKEPAKGLLPELVRRLIQASADGVGDVRFPSGESTFRPGADGLVQAKGSPPYVPAGVSLWELSTEKQPHQKAKRDIEKRSKSGAQDAYLDHKRADIAYVALSLRRWHGEKGQDRDEFESHYRSLGVWKDVKIIDADDLENWLDRSPSVSAWLARKMQIVSGGMKGIEASWDHYSQGVTPAMSEKLLLLNRKEGAEALVQAGMGGGVIRVKADSPSEAAAFVAAAILSMPNEDPRRSALLAKAVVITKPEDDAYLTDTNQKLLVITSGRATDIATQLATRGHTVIAAYGNSHSSSGARSPLIELPRARRQEFADALQEMGMRDVDARVTAGECHSSITVLYRIRDLAGSRHPGWASAPKLRKLAAPILCGAWRHNEPADTKVVADVAGIPYEQVEEAVVDVLLLDDAPILRAGDLTSLSAPADIWQLSIEHRVITKLMLERFRNAALEVLGERDPAFDLPPEQRVYAGIYGKERKYSGALRRGIAEILRLIAINEQKLSYIGNGFSAQDFVDDVLRDILGLASDYQALASLDSLLPDLAEAASIPFLSALETLAAGDGALLSPIFEGSDDPMLGRAYYLGALRGLEVLAWDPTLLGRVTQILARMAELDPGGKLSNRPINSLCQIFLPWKPHTNAQEEVRHHALEQVCRKFPRIAWTLLAKLLLENHAISFGTATPEWREFGASSRPTPTYGSLARDHAFVVQTALPLAGHEASRWMQLVNAAVASQNEAQLGTLLERISDSKEAFVSAGQASLLWEALEGLAAKHRAFATAGWAMPEPMVQKIEECAKHFRPDDPMGLYRPLFDHSLMDRANPDETYEQRNERTGRERDAAIAKIAEGGVDLVLGFAKRVETPGVMSQSIVRATSAEFARNFILAAFNGGEKIAWLAALVTGHGAAHFGFEWAAETIHLVEKKGASAAQVAELLRVWNDTQELFDFVSELSSEVQKAYWETRDTFVRSDDEDLIALGVAKMVEHGRSPELYEFLGSRLERTDSPTLLQVLDLGFNKVVENTEYLRRVDGYWLREIFKALRDRDDVDRDVLMGLEYRWFPVLHSYGEPEAFALHKYMGESPEFFVQVLSDLYRSNDAVESEQEDEEANGGAEETVDDASEAQSQVRAKADIAYKLLESWQKLPWTDDQGKIDYSRMRDWIGKAIDLGKKAGRYEVASAEIGKLLAYAPIDPDDGVWPTRPVRDAVEELANSKLESSLVIELFNKRGVHSRPIDGGGEQERALAEESSQAADQLQHKWPRTADMLRENAQQWLRHAEREDRRAAERRIGL
ncbi:hypothetical protein ACPPVV_00465 [Rhodanobacter sp. Col0626]|uniref:hypothetical protein n=1 Tax=Rhodanobacter sp. Col0626 TaxID=3415679 RepID=UPI003CF8D8CF